MLQQDCGTCGGDRVVIGTIRGARGEDVDDIQPCPTCGDDAGADVDLDAETAPRERHDLIDEQLAHRFDFGGES